MILNGEGASAHITAIKPYLLEKMIFDPIDKETVKIPLGNA